MRMWMTDPTGMCRKHLLGEHVEIHMLAGTLDRGKSIQGHLDRGQLEPQNMRRRHAALVKEMKRRGYKHRSPLSCSATAIPKGRVDVKASERELVSRCPDCRARRKEVRRTSDPSAAG